MDQLAVVLSGLVGAGAVLLATVISNRAAKQQRGEDRRQLEQQRLEDACIEFVRSIDAYVAAIHSIPWGKRRANRLDKLADRYVGDFLALAALLLQRLLYGYRWEGLLDDVIAAGARLRVVAPSNVRTVMDEVHGLLKGGSDLGEEEGAQLWRDLRERLVQEVARAGANSIAG